MNDSMIPAGAATPPRDGKIKKIFGVIGKFLQKYSYFFGKVGISLVTLILSTIALFFLLRMIPGDIVELYALDRKSTRLNSSHNA